MNNDHRLSIARSRNPSHFSLAVFADFSKNAKTLFFGPSFPFFMVHLRFSLLTGRRHLCLFRFRREACPPSFLFFFITSLRTSLQLGAPPAMSDAAAHFLPVFEDNACLALL